jgi:O-antigen ligase
MYLKTLAIFWLLGNVVNTRPRLRLVAWGLALMAVPLAVFGVHEYLAGRFLDGGPVKRIMSYDAPLTQNPNDLALMLNLILPVTLALALLQDATVPRLLLLGCAALDAVAVILTFSRAGFICLAMTAVITFARLVSRPGRTWAIAALAMVLLCAPLLPSGYLERLATITDIGSDPTGSAQERWGDTLAAVRLVSRSPIIGAGAGMNILALNEARGAIWKKVHNVYLEYAVDLGLPGLLLFLAILGGCFRSTALVMRRTADRPAWRDLFLLAEGIQVSLAVFAVAALFHPVAYHFYFYYMAGLALAARAVCEAEARR